MKTKKTLFAAILLLGIGLTNCTKPEKGEKGEMGTAGLNGNANVTTANLTVSSWNWDATNQWSTASWSSVSILTQDAVDNGAVMLYEGTAGDWLAMPYTLGLGMSSNMTISANFEYGLNSITVYKSFSDGSNPSPSSTQFKLVCIPTRSMQLHPEVNVKNYAQVKSAFNLKD